MSWGDGKGGLLAGRWECIVRLLTRQNGERNRKQQAGRQLKHTGVEAKKSRFLSISSFSVDIGNRLAGVAVS